LTDLQNSKKINTSLNVMKCVAVFAVIVIHTMVLYDHGKFDKMIISTSRFAVPFFFLISGFYSYYTSNEYAGVKYKNRIIRLLKLIIISGALFFTYKFITTGSIFQAIPNLNISSIINIFIFNISPFTDPLWFLQALLYCYLIFYILNKYKFKISKLYLLIPILLAGCLLLGVGSHLLDLNIHKMYYRNFLFMGLPFFLMGYLIHDKQDKIDNISNKLLVLGIFSFILVTLFEPVITKAYCDLYLGSAILAILIMIWCVKNPQKLNFKIMAWIGGSLYAQMYIIHILVIQIFKNQLHFGMFDPFIVFIFTLLLVSISALKR